MFSTAVMTTVQIALIWVAFAIVVGMHASRSGRTGLGWFVLALVISPPLARLLLAALNALAPG